SIWPGRLVLFLYPRLLLFGWFLGPTTSDRDPYVRDTGTRETRLTGRRRGSGSSARCFGRAAARHRWTCGDATRTTALRQWFRLWSRPSDALTVLLFAPPLSIERPVDARGRFAQWRRAPHSWSGCDAAGTTLRRRKARRPMQVQCSKCSQLIALSD